MATTLGNALEFLESFGFYEVILPFLLTFTLVFGVLEKTRIFGTEKVGNEQLPRRNINALVAFAVALMVVAAANVVAAIQQALPQVVLVLIILVSFLLLFGILGKQDDIDVWTQHKTASKIFMVVIFVAVILIFLNAFGFLGATFDIILGSGPVANAVIFLLILAAVIYFIVRRPEERREAKP